MWLEAAAILLATLERRELKELVLESIDFLVCLLGELVVERAQVRECHPPLAVRVWNSRAAGQTKSRRSQIGEEGRKDLEESGRAATTTDESHNLIGC